MFVAPWMAKLAGIRDLRAPSPVPARYWIRLWAVYAVYLGAVAGALFGFLHLVFPQYVGPLAWPLFVSQAVLQATLYAGLGSWHAHRAARFMPLPKSEDLRILQIRHRDRGTVLLEVLGEGLAETDLRGADLRKANLRQIDLQSANLEGADLRGAYLGYADLRGANLRGAFLEGADFEGADVRGTDFRQAVLGYILGIGSLQQALYDTATQWPEGVSPKTEGCTLATPERMPIPATAPGVTTESLPRPASACKFTPNDRPVPARDADSPGVLPGPCESASFDRMGSGS